MTYADKHTGVVFDAFPYPPYGVQQDFMANLYDALENGGVSLFESPTGTGKTLSLICGILKWLEDKSKTDKEEQSHAASSEDNKENIPDWMVAFTAPKSEATISLKPATSKFRAHKSALKTQETVNSEEAAFLPAAWGQDLDQPDAKRQCTGPLTAIPDSDSETEADAVYKHRQVYFTSRTHSQLSQFVGELKKTRYQKSVSLAALASRQALCINSEVTKLKSSAAINERCLELQKPAKDQEKGSKRCKCPYFSPSSAAKQDVQETISRVPMDIEELGGLGKQKGVCPYYAARAALPSSDVVLLPYSGLLSQETRDAFGVKLENSILVIDEAHNLVNAINDLHSSQISLPQLMSARLKLATYHSKFQTRLAPGNSQNIQLLIHILDHLIGFLENPGTDLPAGAAEDTGSRIRSVNDFLFMTSLDNVNFFNLKRYMSESKIMFKVAGYNEANLNFDPGGSTHAKGLPASDDNCRGAAPLQALQSFCVAMSSRDADGRVVIDNNSQTCKFILLHAAQKFAKVIGQAQSVILASGTLSPFDSLKAQAFPEQKVKTFACGHVIPRDHLLAVALQKGPSGDDLDFRHKKRSEAKSFEQLGRLLVNFCQVVPQGVVVFFPSFHYADEAVASWKTSGLWASMQKKKKVFSEPKTANMVESTLSKYHSCIEESTEYEQGRTQDGALLLCVVGGKLAEGINFGDGLGRCVVMAGMPYPNPTDPELKERMRYMEADGKDWGQMYYEDLCFKAVNQCIGRVIRHSTDWAVIILADARWASQAQKGIAARKQLPGWIQESLIVSKTFGDAFARTSRFCRRLHGLQACR